MKSTENIVALMAFLLALSACARADITIFDSNTAISDGDSETVGKESHSLKGGAANLTADKLSKIAYQLERIGKSDSLEGCSEVMDNLEKELQRLENYFRNGM